mgnify:CR=1 FL=1
MECGEGVGLKEGLKREREDSGMEWGEGVGLKEGLKRERERGVSKKCIMQVNKDPPPPPKKRN